MKRTEKDLHISLFRLNFAAKYKKNSSQMLQHSEKSLSLPRQLRKTGDIEESY